MMTQAGIIVTMHEPTAILNACEFLKNVASRISSHNFKDRPDALAAINSFKSSSESVGMDSAQALNRAVARIDPDADIDALVLRALARSRNSQLEAAIADATAATTAQPASLAFYMTRAIPNRTKGRLDSAGAGLRRIMRLMPGKKTFKTLFARIQNGIQSKLPAAHENPLPAQPTLG